MTGRREGCGPQEGRRQTWMGDKQRKTIEEGLAFGEYCNLKARRQPQEGPADEIWQKGGGKGKKRNGREALWTGDGSLKRRVVCFFSFVWCTSERDLCLFPPRLDLCCSTLLRFISISNQSQKLWAFEGPAAILTGMISASLEIASDYTTTQSASCEGC